VAEHSDVRDRFYAVLKTFATDNSLRIEHKGVEFTPADDETWLVFSFETRRPEKYYAGTGYQSNEGGFCQVDVIGPESRKQKAFELIAWDVRNAYWPQTSTTGPTLGTGPIVRLGPEPPWVRNHPAPGAGRLGSLVSIDWHADFPRL
jgi:hypothetical protein